MKNIVAWVLCILLGIFFLYNAYPKLTQNPDTVGFFEMVGYGTAFLLLIGVLEALGGILLFFPRFATWGAGIIAVVMVGAAYTHISNDIGSPTRALVSLVVALVIAWLRKDEAIGLSSS
jgi:uncharacterized membrane protein YphA (DoxX/SURF4 family)